MIYITQLIYLKEGQESMFDQFEEIAIPIISKYKGQLLLRMRPGSTNIIESNIENPYEVHLIRFDNEMDFENFMKDEDRKMFLHLKEEAIKSSLLIKGSQI